jgi:hypothetical protein
MICTINLRRRLLRKAVKSVFALLVALVFLSFLLPSAFSQDSQPIVENLDVGSTVEKGSVLYLNFDENYGKNVYDSSGKNNHGTLINFNLNENDPWVEGVRGSALNFDGADDYVRISYDPSLHPDSITIMAWVKLDPGHTTVHEIVRPESGDGYWLVVNSDTGKVHFGYRNADGSDYREVVSSVAVTWGEWTFIGGSMDPLGELGAKRRVWVNDVIDWFEPWESRRVDDKSTVRIGKWSTLYAKGVIDEVRIYDYSLSESEILQQYLARVEGYIDFSPLISWSYYDINENQQVTFQIQVGVNETDGSLWDYTENNSNTWITYAGLPLTADVTYYVRVRAYDGHVWSNWDSTTFKIIRQARFELSNQTIDPEKVLPGGSVTIAVDVTNVGEVRGSYPVVLTIEGVTTDTKVVTLNPGETEHVTFVVVVDSKYDVDIGGLQGTLEVVYFSPAVSNFIIATFIAVLMTIIAIFVKSKLKSGKKGA